nr:MAG TPA: hypothetical protein [Caudoviricetes sp.]
MDYFQKEKIKNIIKSCVHALIGAVIAIATMKLFG